MSKHDSRKMAIKMLYIIDFNHITINEAFKHLEDEVIDDDAVKYVEGVLSTDVDSVISNNLVNYTINRLNKVDLAIIRLATYEMMKSDLASSIIINEALKLTDEFSDEGNKKAVHFNNKLLDNIKKSLGR